MAEQYRPFHCGSQAGEWQEQCHHCTKGFKTEDDHGDCQILTAINDAWWGDGKVPEDIAERMGFLDHSPPRIKGYYYVWNCKEFERRAGTDNAT